ncbi:damage-control phosphatase ARMT1 isoform X2 [Psammomys obesus]|uniref:damage-control phosphatase ARMT1 isoform X2 n=1 Tax=Psammomys obesus TaxID=48139 RepID=UPI002452F211|nr:damage-control phosphatase ARMT1 isoform X2 [Psammomys obesus]
MAEPPGFLTAQDVGSFAYLTIKDRTPQILTKAIDTLHRHKSEFFEKHGEEGVEAEKKAISLLSKLRNEMQTDKPIIPLVDKGDDADIWNQYLEYQRSLLTDSGEAPRWFFSPWLFVECYMYRRIHEALIQSPPIHDFDVFQESKNANFFESQESIDALCEYLQQLKSAKDLGENHLKDEFLKLLQETADHPPEVRATQEQLNHYRNVAENVQSELAATLVKFECAQSELRELRSKVLSKEVCCQELKAEMESYKENSARKSSLLTSLRGRVQELQEESATFSAFKIRAESSVHAMRKENQELMKKVLELEEKLQNCSKENEESKKQGLENLRKHEKIWTQLCDSLSLDVKPEETSDKDLILKLRELCEENTSLKAQVITLEETINVHEMEAKANRETIVRLAAEVSREQERAASLAKERDQLNQDVLSAVEERTTLERKAKLFQERLLAVQRAWDASKQELNQLRKSCQQLDLSVRASRDAAAASQSQSSCFREKLAALLSSRFDIPEPTEDALLERVRELGIQEESQKRMVSQLEVRVSELVEQSGKESEFHQKARQRAHEAEEKLETLQHQLSHLEGELLSGDISRDNLSLEKQKLKTQKERLESKEVHMNLLRQKIAQLQQEKQARSALAVEKDEAHLAVRKLEKKVERMQKELSACREHNTELKAKLADTSDLKIKTLEQTKAIEDLNKSRDELEKMKEQAEKKLMSVKSELDSTEEEAKAYKERARAMIEVAVFELNTMRKSLDEAERREQQLVDFREAVSSLLGLNTTSLVIPDCDIIRCLERLIHHHHFVPCACLTDDRRPRRGQEGQQSQPN